jgi:RNA recognition motif-containing protein
MTQAYHQRNQDATVWVGNLDTQTTEELIFELFVNVGALSAFVV